MQWQANGSCWMIGWIVVARITACDVSESCQWHYTTYCFGYQGDPNDLCTEVRFHFGRKIACSSIDSQCDDTHSYERRFLSHRCIIVNRRFNVVGRRECCGTVTWARES
ncbi:hypothetical protein F5888DRAFT_1703275 [Russula emetica]|nr:hypothetical protein F5888DRAFT_1703275 [Russula emetica]